MKAKKCIYKEKTYNEKCCFGGCTKMIKWILTIGRFFVIVINMVMIGEAFITYKDVDFEFLEFSIVNKCSGPVLNFAMKMFKS